MTVLPNLAPLSYLSVDGEEGWPPNGGEVVVGHAVALALAGDGAQVADQARQGAAVDPGELGEEDAVPEIRIHIGFDDASKYQQS